MYKKKILITEDERIIAEDLRLTLCDLGFDVIGISASGEDAIGKIEEYKPDLVLMDIMLEGELTGIETAAHILDCFKIPVIYITAYADNKTLTCARKTLPAGFLFKPFEEGELTNIIAHTFDNYLMN